MDQFEQRGGVRADNFNATWPFGRLVVTRDSVDVFVTGFHYHFPKADLTTLRPYRGLVSRGLQIGHRLSSPPVPHVLVFWSFDYTGLRRALESFGYTVLGREHERKWWQDVFGSRRARRSEKRQ